MLVKNSQLLGKNFQKSWGDKIFWLTVYRMWQNKIILYENLEIFQVNEGTFVKYCEFIKDKYLVHIFMIILVSDIAIFVLKRDVKHQLTN